MERKQAINKTTPSFYNISHPLLKNKKRSPTPSYTTNKRIIFIRIFYMEMYLSDRNSNTHTTAHQRIQNETGWNCEAVMELWLQGLLYEEIHAGVSN